MPNHFPMKGSFHPLGGASIDFVATDWDEDNDTKYWGFVDHRGTWLIMEEITSSGSARFASGKDNYPTNWTGRAGLSYGYYYEL